VVAEAPDKTFYWFDYETFGISPAWDKPAQFAGQRTTLALEPVGDPLVIYCAPPLDYLPHPEACLVTGMDPADIKKRGMVEPEFIARVVAELGKPGTCSVGYNSIRFDDEFTRHTLFRNFFDPYEYEWKDGNSRWDLLDVVRMARALRPEGITWPVLDDGSATNKLELLTKANNIEHGHAHDALSDVLATIDMARLLKEKQPKLYDYAFANKDKRSVAQLLNIQQRKACVHISGMVPGNFGHASIVVPIAQHPSNQNGVIVLDMRSDPSEIATLNTEEIHRRVFSSSDELGDVERLHIRTIQINKCPVLAPLSTLTKESAHRLNIDYDLQLQRVDTLNSLFGDKLAGDELADNVRKSIDRKFDSQTNDIDGTLYSGRFLSQHDKQLSTQVRRSKPKDLASMEGLFEDKNRLDALLYRYRCRNFPETLDSEERSQWLRHCAERLGNDDKPWLSFNGFDAAMKASTWESGTEQLRESLYKYVESIRQKLNNV